MIGDYTSFLMSFPSAGQVFRTTRQYYRLLPRHHSRLPGRYNLHHLRHGHGAFCSSWQNGTLTVASHLSHEKSANQTSANKPSLEKRSIQQSIGQNSQTPKNFQECNHNSTPIDSDVKPSQKLAISPQTYRFSSKLPLHRSETRTNSKNFKQPIENRTNSKKLRETDRKLERTVENFKLPIQTQTNGGKLQFTERKLERTVKNGCTSTQPHRDCRNFKNSRCGWEQVLHGHTVGA